MTTTTINSNGHVSLKGLESLAALLPATEPLASTEVEAKPEPKTAKKSKAIEEPTPEEIALANKVGNPEPKTAKKAKAKQPKIEAAPIKAKEEFSEAIDVLSHSGRTAVFYSKDIHKAGKYQRTDVYALIGDGLDWTLSQLNPETGATKSEIASVTFSRFDGIEFLSMKRDPEFMSEVFNGFLYNLQHATSRQAKIADRLFAVSLVTMTLIRGSILVSDNIRVNGKQSPITSTQWQAILDKTCEMFSWFSQDDRTNAEKFLRAMKAI